MPPKCDFGHLNGDFVGRGTDDGHLSNLRDCRQFVTHLLSRCFEGERIEISRHRNIDDSLRVVHVPYDRGLSFDRERRDCIDVTFDFVEDFSRVRSQFKLDQDAAHAFGCGRLDLFNAV